MDELRPWEDYPEIWPTKAKFFAWLRGGLRRGLFEKYPPKIQFKKGKCGPPPKDYTGRGRKGTECALTGKWTPTSQLEVDHVIGHASLKGWDDLLPFVLHLLSYDYQLLSKEAHRIKSYAERMNITYEEAALRKEAIAFGKLPVKVQKGILKEKGCKEDVLSNAAKRKEAYLQLLKEESNVN